MIDRYYSDNVGPIKENELLALKKAIEIVQDHNEINEITIVIHTKNTTGYLERIFGTRNLNPYFKGIKVHPQLPIIKVETTRTIDDYNNKKRVLLAFGLRSEELFIFDEYESVKAIVAHQWAKDDIKQWAATWAAKNILTGTAMLKEELPDIIVQRAFDDLTTSVNMSTGILHPSDEELCKTYLRALHKYNYNLDATQINSYLINELGWKFEYAKDIIKLIDKLNSGKRFVGGDSTGLQFHVKRWKLMN